MLPRKCPPCRGDCRQGRDCAAGEREPINWFAVVGYTGLVVWAVLFGIAMWNLAQVAWYLLTH